jgi:hypothetical protein
MCRTRAFRKRSEQSGFLVGRQSAERAYGLIMPLQTWAIFFTIIGPQTHEAVGNL